MIDDEFVIDLDDAAVRELENAYGGDKLKTDLAPAIKTERAERPKPAPTKAASDAPTKTQAPDGDLLRRLRDAEERAATERARRLEAERIAHDRGTTAAISMARAAESDYHAVANALTRAETDVASHKFAHQSALESGDYKLATEAAERLSEAKARIAQLQDGKAALEDRVRSASAAAHTAVKSEAPRGDVSSDPLDQFFASTNMPPKAQAWFREHPECAPTNDRGNYFKALAEHERIVKSGVQDGSDEYYRKLDEAMGYARGDDAADDGDVVIDRATAKREAAPKPKRVAAPVARDTSMMHRGADGKVQLKLTAEQAKMADEIGMTRTNYAKYLYMAEREGKLGGHALG